MQMSRERLYELGLVIDKDTCLSCINCIEDSGKACCSLMVDLTVDEAIESDLICPERNLKEVLGKMTEEEIYSLRRNNISIL